MSTESTTQALVRFSTHFDFGALPSEVVRQTKTIVLDMFGAMLAASAPQYSAGRITSDFAKALGGPAEATIVGRDFKTSCLGAAIANGTLGYACDIEPYYKGAVMHPPASVLPAAMAVAEREHKSGKDFIASVVLGIDVACRASLAINPVAMYERTFHPSAVAGAFGATAAAGNLLGIDEGQFSNAFGLAATQASGLLAFGSDETENSRPFNCGIAARNGVTAAMLASMGFGGPQRILDGDAKYNIYRAFSKEGQPEKFTDRLGEHFYIMEHSIKLYACCGFLHTGLDGLLDIMENESLLAEDVTEIVLRFAKTGAAMIDNNPLKSHCAQYVLPLAAVNRKVLPGDVLLERNPDARIDRLSGCTSMEYDDELEKTFPTLHTAIVHVAVTDGRRFTRKVEWARGMPQNPCSEDELLRKFMWLAGTVVSEDRAREIVDIVGRLEEIQDIGQLAGLLQVRA